VLIDNLAGTEGDLGIRGRYLRGGFGTDVVGQVCRICTAAFALQHTAFALQHTAFALQHTAFALQHNRAGLPHLHCNTTTLGQVCRICIVLQCVLVCCSVLPWGAV